jgi:hypothetical protein
MINLAFVVSGFVLGGTAPALRAVAKGSETPSGSAERRA